MSQLVQQILQELTPRMDMAAFVSSTILRLVLAAFLGGIIGLEREMKRKPAGLRTNMFICFGAAMFTILSERLAVGMGSDQTRIAAQIIPGIGFIGAGSILHSRGGVAGLTTAATLFVVASVGMAVGAGQYLIALFAALVIFIALHFLGWLEGRLNLKSLQMTYEVRGPEAEKLIAEINSALEDEHRMMEAVQLSGTAGQYRVHFSTSATHQQHALLLRRLRQSESITHAESLRGVEEE